MSATRCGKNLQKTESHGEGLYARTHYLWRKRGPNLKLEDTSARKLDAAKQILFAVTANPTLVEPSMREAA